MYARRIRTGAFTRLPKYSARMFRTSAPLCVKVGDTIPDVELVEDSPGNKVSIAKELKGKGLVIGVPAAFSKPVTDCFSGFGLH